MRAARLVALLLRLQSGGGATAAELADALDVSVRTIYRDVADLQGAGFPLWTEAGPGGGIRLVEGWRTRLDGLSGDEAMALLLGAAPAAAASELGLATAAAAAREKVLGTVPPELRRRAEAVAERFLLDAPGWFQRPDDVPHLAALSRAVWDERRAVVGYRRGDGEVERTLDPLGLVLKAGRWYVAAAVEGQVRSYRVGRVTRVEVLDEPAARPAGFDLADWWAASAAQLAQDILRATVHVRLSPRAQWLLPHLVDPVAARRALDAAAPPDDDGWVEVHLDVEGADVAHDQLLALGDGLQVLAPDELRAAIAHSARALLARHSPQ